VLLSEWRLEQFSVIGVESWYQPEWAKHGTVFGVMVQIFGRIRVSRYKADRKQVSYHLIAILLIALAQYRGTSLHRSQDCVMLQELN
jgi:hypothetical protein